MSAGDRCDLYFVVAFRSVSKVACHFFGHVFVDVKSTEQGHGIFWLYKFSLPCTDGTPKFQAYESNIKAMCNSIN